MNSMRPYPIGQKTFGQRLKVLRIDRGISQVELRQRMIDECEVEIGSTYISELERSHKAPSLTIASAMARVLGVSLDYLGMLVNEPFSYERHVSSSNFDRVVAG